MQDKSTSKPSGNRLDFIEGLKGIGAMQVVALHYICAFLPAMARAGGEPRYAWESWVATSPLFVLFNGYAAFNLFFLMSGFVLAPSFARINGGWINQIVRRLFRLFLPMACALLIAVLLFLAFPDAKHNANTIAQSGWLEGSANSPLTFDAITKDLFLNSMILGYRERSIAAVFSAIYPHLTSWSQSINGPFWTLHIILWGSYLVLALAWLRQRVKKFHFYLVAFATFLFTSTGGFSLFLIGYLFFDLFQFLQTKQSRTISVLGTISFISGLYVVYTPMLPMLEPIFNLQNSIRSGPTLYSEWLNELGAILIFAGILALPLAKKILSASLFVKLGKLSFSLFLTHFPIIFTISCTLFYALSNAGVDYLQSYLIMVAAGISLSLLVAYYFEKWVDFPCIALTKRLFSGEPSAKPAQNR